MRKNQPSLLLCVSIVCVVALAALPFASRLPSAPWNRPASVPLAKWKTPHRIEQMAWTKDGKSMVTLTQAISLDHWKLDGSTAPVAASSNGSDWLAPGGQWIVQSRSGGALRRIAVTPQNKSFANYGSKTIDLFSNPHLELNDISTGTTTRTFSWPADTMQRRIEGAERIYFSANGNYIACMASVSGRSPDIIDQKAFAVWDIKTSKRLWVRFSNILSRNGAICDLTLSPQGRLLLPIYRRAQSRGKPNAPIWSHLLDMQTGRAVMPLTKAVHISGTYPDCYLTTISARSRRLTFCEENRFGKTQTLYVYNFERRVLAWKWRDKNIHINFSAFSPDERFLAVATTDPGNTRGRVSSGAVARLLVFDARNGKLLVSLHDETPLDRTRQSFAMRWRRADVKTDYIKAFAWSPDSRKLAATYMNGEIKIWAAPK